MQHFEGKFITRIAPHQQTGDRSYIGSVIYVRKVNNDVVYIQDWIGARILPGDWIDNHWREIDPQLVDIPQKLKGYVPSVEVNA